MATFRPTRISVSLRPRYRRDGTLKGYSACFYSAVRRPRRIERSLRTKNERVARQRLADLERALDIHGFDPWTTPAHVEAPTLKAVVDAFIEDRERHCAESTVATYRSVLDGFCDTVGVNLAADVRAEDVERYLTRAVMAEATRRSQRDRVAVFFKWAADQGVVAASPVPKPRRSKASRREELPTFFSDEEEAALLEALAKDKRRWLQSGVELALWTGMRRAELCALRWNTVRLGERVIRVAHSEEFSPKSGRERSVPIVKRCATLLERLREEQGPKPGDFVLRGAKGGPLCASQLSKSFKGVVRDLGQPEELHFHSLRHTFASRWVQRGGDLYSLKEVLGHASISQTQVYARLAPRTLVEQASALFD